MPVVLGVNAVFHDPDGPLPSPYMLFTHQVRPGWRDRIPAVVHVDGSARVQTVHREQQPLVTRVLEAFERRTGVPVLVNTSLNTGGRPMVDSPRVGLECFGSSPVDVMAIGPTEAGSTVVCALCAASPVDRHRRATSGGAWRPARGSPRRE
jgi:carbamoyltransferase